MFAMKTVNVVFFFLLRLFLDRVYLITKLEIRGTTFKINFDIA